MYLLPFLIISVRGMRKEEYLENSAPISLQGRLGITALLYIRSVKPLHFAVWRSRNAFCSPYR